MLKRLRREAILTGSLLAGVVAFSILGYYLSDGGAFDSPSPSSAAEQPLTLPWQPTGSYRTEKDGIGLTVHSYRIRPDRMAFLYSLSTSTADLAASPGTVSLTDDLGQTYPVLSNAILGSALGVTAGLVVTETYTGKGETLTLTVTDVVTSGSAAAIEKVRGTWSVPFIKTLAPGAPVHYSTGGRILPEVMSAGDLTLAVAGPPGGRLQKLLIDRQGQQAALYGEVSGNLARSLSELEFHTQLRATNEANAQLVPAEARSTAEVFDDLAAPYDFPTPQSVP